MFTASDVEIASLSNIDYHRNLPIDNILHMHSPGITYKGTNELSQSTCMHACTGGSHRSLVEAQLREVQFSWIAKDALQYFVHIIFSCTREDVFQYVHVQACTLIFADNNGSLENIQLYRI